MTTPPLALTSDEVVIVIRHSPRSGELNVQAPENIVLAAGMLSMATSLVLARAQMGAKPLLGATLM